MLSELASFPQLTKLEKFNLVNLGEVTIVGARETAESTTLCDICLVVPSIRDWTIESEVSRLCQLVYRYKRVVLVNEQH